MSLEQFFKLKEIDSLSKMRFKHLQEQKEQEDRLSKLTLRCQESDSQSAILKQEFISLQHKLFETEKKLKVASEQKQRLLDIGGDEKKVSALIEEEKKLEEEGFGLLGALEENERESAEIKTFREGLEKTIIEITAEVATIQATLGNEIKNIYLRLKLLEDELSPEFLLTYRRIRDKNLAHGPFTRLDQGSCYFCRFKITRMEESEIDMQKSLKTCGQCGRIFLPYGV